jgi:glycosyltransferase involved in cell wall biosynthesis
MARLREKLTLASSDAAMRAGTGGDLRVCHVIHSLRQGGAEHVLVSLAAVARTAGLTVSVLSLMPDDDLPYADDLCRLGLEVRSLGLGTRWDARGLQRAVRTVEELRPDLLHTHLKHADLVGTYVSRRLGVPMVSTLHLIEEVQRPVARLKRRLAAQARLRAAARTITVSDAQRDWYLATFRADAARVTTVRNGVPAPPQPRSQERRELRAALGASATGAVVSMVSMMRPEKGHADLLAALDHVPAEIDLRVVLAGDGPCRPTLEATVAASEGLRRRVVFTGFVGDVDALFAASDVIVQPSHHDALPTALIHGLAAGVPIVATRVGGIPEIVGREAGLLVPRQDPEALGAALTAICADAGLRDRLGAGGRRRFEAGFEAGAWARRLREVYVEVLTGSTG